MSNEILEVLQQIVIKTVGTLKLCNAMFGTVTQERPLLISLGEHQTLDEDFIFKTPVTSGLKKGDKVILLRLEGGQDFLVLDKVVDE